MIYFAKGDHNIRARVQNIQKIGNRCDFSALRTGERVEKGYPPSLLIITEAHLDFHQKFRPI